MKTTFIVAVILLCLGCDGGGDEQPPTPLRCSGEVGPEIDLAQYARLTASNTRGDEVFGWVREAEDAVATIRDSTPATSWKLPVGQPATIEIDLQPWLGRPTSLDRLELGFEGPSPSVDVELLDGCGGGVLERLPWPTDGESLDLEGRCAACLRLQFEAIEDESELVELRLVSRDATIDEPIIDARAIGPAEARFPRSGAIEGFYGVPWSWRERQRMILSLARAGLDTYLYAPKHDDLHRARWREPYPPEVRAEIAALAALGREVGVTVYLGISPFLDLDAESDEDFEVLRDKLMGFLDDGIEGVAVLADDIEMGGDLAVDGELARFHVEVVERLAAALREANPDVRILFVPTAYSDDRVDDFEDGPGYLEALTELDPQIGVMWTGQGTFCETMTASDMDRFTELTGRAPVIWDNYWANDAMNLFGGDLFLAPLEGRSEDLPAAVEGLAFNLSIQGAPSRLMMSLAAWYLANPGPADPEAARIFATDLETLFSAGAASDPSHEAELLRQVMTLYDGHGARATTCLPLAEGVERLQDALSRGGSPPVDEVAALLSLFASMTTLGESVHHSGLDPDLVDDLIFPLEKARHEGQAGLWALSLLSERLAGREGLEAHQAAAAALTASREARYRLGSGEVQGLFNVVSDLTPASTPAVVSLSPSALPSSCRAGEPVSFIPFDIDDSTEAAIEVSGLPGASVQDDTVTFTPPYAGQFRAVATAVVGGARPGWAFRELELVCRVAVEDEL